MSRRVSGFVLVSNHFLSTDIKANIAQGNGEVIDFYADSTKDKEGWMNALAGAVGKSGGSVSSWADIVLRREEAERAKELRRKVSGGSGGSGSGRKGNHHHHQKSRSMIA